jgi:hypothetical protein
VLKTGLLAFVFLSLQRTIIAIGQRGLSESQRVDRLTKKEKRERKREMREEFERDMCARESLREKNMI